MSEDKVANYEAQTTELYNRIDELTEQLKTAQELIKFCRDKLTNTDAEIKKILDKSE